MAEVAAAVDHQVLDKFSQSEGIENSKLKTLQKLKNLQKQKKLCLILDLDHTLIHSTHVKNFTKSTAGSSDDIFEHRDVRRMVKLRPFVQVFLKEACKLFEMYIYTLGTRRYAKGVAKVLDPDGVYFGSRIISSKNSTSKLIKSLDVLPDVDESFVLVLDDLKCVWPRYSRNLILMKQYVYFDPPDRVFSDEEEGSGALSCALKVLKEVHTLYFERDNPSEECDVRDLLEIVLKNSSKGISIDLL